MNHNFQPSITNPDKCARCPYNKLTHTDRAICEACNNEGTVDLMYGTVLLCASCIEKEKALITENQKPENQQARVDTMNQALETSRKIDAEVAVRTDLFNAATVAIISIKAAIDSDDSITNKPYKLAEVLTERFQHFKSVAFEASQTLVDAGNNQKAIQTYLNQMANTLRAEERAALKISDISYQPTNVKPVKPATIKTTSKKLDKVELRKLASEIGCNEFTLQMVAVSKGISLVDAANIIRRSVAEAKSESTPVKE